MSRVFELSKAEGTDRLVMLALADFCDDQGVCFPGIARIAKKCLVSTRTVQRSLSRLCELGELWCESGAGIEVKGHGFTNRYKVRLSGCQSVIPVDRGDTGGKTGVSNRASRGVIAVSPESSGESSGEPSGASADSLCSFSEPPPSHYPRKARPPKVTPTPRRDEVIAFVESLGEKRSAGVSVFLKFEAKGWPKKWKDEVRWHRDQKWAPFDKGVAVKVEPSIARTAEPKL